MRHLRLASIILWAALAAYQCGLLLMPRFHLQLTQDPLLLVLVSGLSCLAIWFGGVSLLVVLPWYLRLIFSSIVAVLLVLHIRIVEILGWALRPEYIGLLQTPASLRGAWAFFIASPTPAQLLLAIVLLSGFLHIVLKRIGPIFSAGKRKSLFASPVFLLLSILLINAAEGASKKYRLSSELTRQALLHVSQSFIEYALNNPDLSRPDLQDLAEVRQHFSKQRSWTDGSSRYPLWQAKVWSGSEPRTSVEDQTDESLRRDLQAWLAAEAQSKGPWNVVLVQQESLRAHELAAFKDADRGTDAYAAETPGLNRLIAEGIRFTQVLGTGDMTHYGELASGCSLYALPFHNILLNAPDTPIQCLMDAFAQRDYTTVFAVGTDPRVNARERFYPRHGAKLVWTEPSFAPNLTRLGWGLSDRAFYQEVVSRLEHLSSPFYAQLLTLSNHAPFLTPPDQEAGSSRFGDQRRIMLRYIDDAFTVFYRELTQRHPHTIVVLAADHGEWPEGGYAVDEITASAAQKLHRLPLALLIPNLPDALRGRQVSRLGSDADLAPTLLNLLGMSDIPNAFMGEDLFRRQEPVVMKWGEQWLTVKQSGQTLEFSPAWGRARRLNWGALGKYGLFMPEPSVAKGDAIENRTPSSQRADSSDHPISFTSSGGH